MEIIAASESANGKRNAYHTDCSCVGHRRPYAACLSLIDRRAHGRLDTMYSDCSGHIGQKRCPALSMRKQELAEGKAIFFVERKNSELTVVQQARSTVAQVVRAVKEVVRKPEKKSDEVQIMGTDYAAAINAAIADTKPTPTKSAPEIKPGESLLEAAKRLLKSK